MQTDAAECKYLVDILVDLAAGDRHGGKGRKTKDTFNGRRPLEAICYVPLDLFFPRSIVR